MPEKIDHHNPAHIFIGCTDPGECVYADTTPRESDDRDLFGVLDELSDLLPGAKFNANAYAEAYMLVFKLRNMLEGRSRCTAEQVHRDLGARKSI